MGLHIPIKNDLCAYPRGPRNLLTDVPGVVVGHYTHDQGAVHSGVTAIFPAQDSLFRNKCVAACHVANGFGKSVGLTQIEELGTLETPILLTNTLSVGIVGTALIRHMLADHPEIGRETGTVNPVVMECNDGHLSDIRALAITEEHARIAMEAAAPDFAEGAVGAGRGMVCFGLKGGIGSSSRRIALDSGVYHLGALVLSNFGSRKNLSIFGEAVGRKIAALEPFAEKEKGSIIVVLATDLPLTARQLKRLCKRAEVGIIRTGGYIGNDSGEIVLGFTTANRQPHAGEGLLEARQVAEGLMDTLFTAAASATEEAILSSLYHSETLTGRDGHTIYALRDVWKR